MTTQRVPRQPALSPIKSVRYRRLPVPNVSTGGGSAVARWGPNFGTPGGDSLPQKSTLALPSVGLSGDLPQRHTLGGRIGIGPFAGPNQVQALAGTIGPSYSGPGQVQAIRHSQLALSGALGQVEAIRHTALALSGGVAQIQAMRHSELALAGGIAQVHANRHTILALAGGIGQVQSPRHTLLGLTGGVAHRHALGGKARGAPFWRSVATTPLATTLGATEIVANLPAVNDDELMVAWVTADGLTGNNPDVNVPTGWTSVTGVISLGRYKGRVLLKIASGEGSTQTFTFAATASHATAEVHRIVGFDTTTPNNYTNQGTASVIDPIVVNAIPDVANCLVFVFLGHIHTVAQTHAPPANHIERTEFSDTNVDLRSSSSYTRIFAATGDTGTATVDCNELVASSALYARVAIAPGDLLF